jgi:hypothetical protein
MSERLSEKTQQGLENDAVEAVELSDEELEGVAGGWGGDPGGDPPPPPPTGGGGP